MKTRVGLQLYSIRQEMQSDFLGSLERVRAAGYDCVEFAGYGGFAAARLKDELARIGLEPYSSHVGYDKMDQQLGQVAEFGAELGLSWLICPYYKLVEEEDCRRLATVLARAAHVLHPYGIRVAYHNHAGDFRKINGRYALDLLLDHTGDAPVFLEVDTCWAVYAGVDPLAYIEKLGSRSGPIHCKDINADYARLKPEQIDAEIGGGIIDFARIVEAARQSRTLQHGLIVEQEAFTMDPFESIAISCRHLRGLLANGGHD
jgi:sugar phosphate isomerase/epimerase